MNRSFSNRILNNIKLLDREGNINGVIAEVAKTEKQYDAYLIDTCIKMRVS